MYTNSKNFGWKSFELFDFLCNCSITDKGPLTWKRKIYRAFFISANIGYTLLALSNLIQYHNRIPSLIISSAAVMSQLTGSWALYKFTANNRDFETVINWLKNAERTYFINFGKKNESYVKWIKLFIPISSIFGVISLTIVFIIGYIFPGLVFSKFEPPLPFYLPIKNRDNWFIYFVTSYIEIAGLYTGTCVLNEGISVLFIFYFNVVAYYDVILLKISIMVEKNVQRDFSRNISTIMDMILDTFR